MSANDEFPRGGFIGTGNAANPILTIPGTANIVKVLTGARAIFYNETVNPIQASLQVTDGTVTYLLSTSAVSSGSASVLSLASMSWAGKIFFTVGSGFTLTLTPALGVNMAGEIDVDWIDI